MARAMMRVASYRRSLRGAAWIAVAIMVEAGCGSQSLTGTDGGAAPPPALQCDDTIKTQFAPDASTQVLLVKLFKQGDPVALSNTPATPAPPTAAADVCLVKLLVGPGNPGPAGAPSTSTGIGIEVWLPAAASWNERIRVYGSGG